MWMLSNIEFSLGLAHSRKHEETSDDRVMGLLSFDRHSFSSSPGDVWAAQSASATRRQSEEDVSVSAALVSVR